MLAACRSTPPELAGRWELPGGKAEPGESPSDALVRELAEELGVVAVVRRWLPGRAAISARHVLQVAIVEIDGEPEPREHSELRWVGPSELDALDWLDSDRPFLTHVRAALGAPPIISP